MTGFFGMRVDNRGGNMQRKALQGGAGPRRGVVGIGLVFMLAMAAVLSAPAVSLGASGAALTNSVKGRITKGPCLLRAYQDRACLMWETDVEEGWGVRYTAEGGPESRHDSDRPEKLSKAYVHKVWIDGLEAGRRYRYQIVGPGVPSETYEFRTVPAQTDEVRFVIYGDTRTNASVHRRIVEQIMKHELDFVVHVGDLVSRGDEYRLWSPQFFEPLKGLVERVPMYIARGNHEGRNGTYEKLLMPPEEKSDARLDYGPLHLFCADNVSERARAGDLALDIARDAQASDARWKFAVYHVPSVNFGGHRSNWQQKEALPAFAKAGMDFVVTGHSHLYERFRPVAPLGQGQYVTYITAGGGGAPLYKIEPTACHACAKSVYQFCLFHIKGDTLTMDTIDMEGRVIDHIQVVKENGQPDGQYVQAAVSMSAIRLYSLLYESLENALPKKAVKGRPFTVNVHLTVPELFDDARLTFELRGGSEAFDLPPAETVAIARKGGSVRAELTATPSASALRSEDGEASNSLWLDCHYEFGAMKETISLPVVVADN